MLKGDTYEEWLCLRESVFFCWALGCLGVSRDFPAALQGFESLWGSSWRVSSGLALLSWGSFVEALWMRSFCMQAKDSP